MNSWLFFMYYCNLSGPKAKILSLLIRTHIKRIEASEYTIRSNLYEGNIEEIV